MMDYDRELEAEVRMALISLGDPDDTRIQIRAREGVVTLSGRAFSEDEKQRAEEVAGSLRGVARVVNELEVCP